MWRRRRWSCAPCSTKSARSSLPETLLRTPRPRRRLHATLACSLTRRRHSLTTTRGPPLSSCPHRHPSLLPLVGSADRQAAAAKATKADEAAAREDSRCDAIYAQLESLSPHLAATVVRLEEHLATLDHAPVTLLSPLPAHYVPAGLEVPTARQPVHLRVRSHLEQLDALLQSMQSRVTRLSTLRGVDESPNGEPISKLDPLLKLFTELPPEVSFAETKALRQEIELALSKRREADEAAS